MVKGWTGSPQVLAQRLGSEGLRGRRSWGAVVKRIESRGNFAFSRPSRRKAAGLAKSMEPYLASLQAGDHLGAFRRARIGTFATLYAFDAGSLLLFCKGIVDDGTLRQLASTVHAYRIKVKLTLATSSEMVKVSFAPTYAELKAAAAKAFPALPPLLFRETPRQTSSRGSALCA